MIEEMFLAYMGANAAMLLLILGLTIKNSRDNAVLRARTDFIYSQIQTTVKFKDGHAHA